MVNAVLEVPDRETFDVTSCGFILAGGEKTPEPVHDASWPPSRTPGSPTPTD